MLASPRPSPHPCRWRPRPRPRPSAMAARPPFKAYLSSRNTQNHALPFLNCSCSALSISSSHNPRPLSVARATVASQSQSPSPSPTTFHGTCYVVGDNIDTDQIIPAEHLTLVPSKPDEYIKLGSHAFCGLPASSYPIPFIEPGKESTVYPIVIAGSNFGCGSSREHAPVALGAAGVRVVIAEYYARIFFRNSVATGEVYPVEVEKNGLFKECTTGDTVTVDLEKSVLINHTTGKEYKLKPIGDAGPVIEAGGIFAYARKTGMIASVS